MNTYTRIRQLKAEARKKQRNIAKLKKDLEDHEEVDTIKNSFTVIYSYFDEDRGSQQFLKEITGNSIKEVVAKMKKHLYKNNTLYQIERVSPNLVDYDFAQNGDEFIGLFSNKRENLEENDPPDKK